MTTSNELRAIAEAAKDVALRLLAGDAADTVWKAAAAITSLLADLEAAEARVPVAFIEAILHGDETHRAWLIEAAAFWNSGRPVPPARTANPTEEAQP